MPDQCDDVVRRFGEACQLGDIVALRAALDADAIAVCDGGGLAGGLPDELCEVQGLAELADQPELGF